MAFGRKARAGAYAEQRYRRGLRSWRAENRLLFFAICAPFIAAGLVVGVLVGDVVAWIGGVVAGAFAAMLTMLRDTPPPYVENWHDGAEGERKTEKALRPLERAGWHIVHDVQTGHGNYDHIAVGPTGLYLLETKNLRGIVDIENGVPHLARRHDPDQNLMFNRIRPRALANAARIKKDVEQRTGHHLWVQAVVVFWSEFPEGLVNDGKCFFVHGSRLRDWMQGRPSRLDRTDVEEIAAAVANIASEAPANAAPASPGLSPT